MSGEPTQRNIFFFFVCKISYHVSPHSASRFFKSHVTQAHAAPPNSQMTDGVGANPARRVRFTTEAYVNLYSEYELQ